MKKRPTPDRGRYVTVIDILGFSELVESTGAADVYRVINDALQAFDRWEQLNGQFRTIYFSDTFILYQEPHGYGDWAFLDAYALSGMILAALLAKHIPARGAIAFGEFEVRADGSGTRDVYFGRALVEAHRAQQAENWIGITILKSAWLPYEAANPGLIDAFERERVWIRRHDDVLLLNPLIKLTGYYDSIGEITQPYMTWDAPEFPNDILAFKFLRDQAAGFMDRGDFSGRVAAKYHATLAFLKRVLGDKLYEWGVTIAPRDIT